MPRWYYQTLPEVAVDSSHGIGDRDRPENVCPRTSSNEEKDYLVAFGIRQRRKCSSLLYLLAYILGGLSVMLIGWIPATMHFYKKHLACSYRNGDLNIDSGSLFRDIDRSFHAERFSSFNYTTSPYTEDPRVSDVDAMWAGLGLDTASFMIPKSQGDTIFKLDEQRHVILPKSMAGGEEDAYIGWFEVLHHLHCLNDLRQNVWFNRDWYKTHGKHHASDGLTIAHINHCLDALRERLMCTSDIGLVPFLWIHWNGDALPDFARQHECRNFDAVRQWAYDHQLSSELRKQNSKPPVNAIMTDLHKHGRD